MTHDKVVYYIGISLIKNLGHINARKLLQKVEDPKHLFEHTYDVLQGMPLQKSIKEDIRSGKTLEKAEEEMNFLSKKGIRALSINDAEYPYRLKECADAPIVLYCKGKHCLNESRLLSVVGTRNASRDGKQICNHIIEGLAGTGVVIISGLALGIDAEAHRSALANQLSTCAVMGHPMTKIYPPSNKDLARDLQKNGCLITDYPSKAVMVPGNFPARNRIIAGLSDATLVVESNIKGGSMITAELALSYDREVLAVPNSPLNKTRLGGNFLIKKNMAALIESPEDVVKHLNWDSSSNVGNTKQLNLFEGLDEEEKQILSLFRDQTELHIDEIRARSNFGSGEISRILLQMELKNIVIKNVGNTYSKSR